MLSRLICPVVMRENAQLAQDYQTWTNYKFCVHEYPQDNVIREFIRGERNQYCPTDEEVEAWRFQNGKSLSTVWKRCLQLKMLRHLVENVLPKKGLEGFSKKFAYLVGKEGENYVISLDASKRQRKVLSRLKPCCRFHALFKEFLADAGVELDICVECMLENRSRAMTCMYMRHRQLARQIALFGPLWDPADGRTLDENDASFMSDARFTGDVYSFNPMVDEYIHKAVDVGLQYSFAPIVLLPEHMRREFYLYVQGATRDEIPGTMELVEQMCGSIGVSTLFTTYVIERRQPDVFDNWCRANDPRKTITAVQKLHQQWTEIREELEQFDTRARLDAKINADLTKLRLEDRKRCRILGCDNFVRGKFKICDMHHKRRREIVEKALARRDGAGLNEPQVGQGGEVQMFNFARAGVDVNIPPELLTFMRRMSGNEPLRVEIEGKFRERGINVMELLYKFALFVVTAYSSWPSKAAISASFMQFVSSLPLADKLGSYLVSFLNTSWELNGLIAGGEGGEAQSADANSDAGAGWTPVSIVASLCSVAIAVASCLFIGKQPGNSDFMNHIRNLSFVGRSITSMETMYDRIKSLITYTIDYIRFDVLKLPRPEQDDQIEKFCDEVMEFKNSGFEKNIKNNSELKEKIDSLLIRADQMLKLADKLHLQMNCRTRLTAAYNFLLACRQATAHSSAGATEPRIAPIIVHFVGASGTGKSSVLWLLMARLLAAMGCRDPRDIHEKTYFKYPTKDERWDGFTSGTKIVVCDDVFSQKDSLNNPSAEPLEAIRMSNTAFWQLTMAHLSEKATTFFKAPVVLWTSNQHSFNFESLTNPEAVSRRITARYRQKPHPDYAVRVVENGKVVERLDQAKIARELERNPMSITNFVLFDKEFPDLSTQVVIKADMTFDEMAAEVIQAHLANAAHGERFNKAVFDYFEQCVREENERRERLIDDEPRPGPSTAGDMQFYQDADPGLYYEEMAEESDRASSFFEYMDQVGVEVNPEDRLIWYDEMPWLASFVDRRRHLCVFETALNYNFFSDVDVAETNVEHDYTYRVGDRVVHLSETNCVKISPRMADRFMKAWVRARAAIVEFIGEPADRRRHFDKVFFSISNINPAAITPCCEHETLGCNFHFRWMAKYIRLRKYWDDSEMRQRFFNMGYARMCRWETSKWYISIGTKLVLLGAIISSYYIVKWVIGKLLELVGWTVGRTKRMLVISQDKIKGFFKGETKSATIEDCVGKEIAKKVRMSIARRIASDDTFAQNRYFFDQCRDSDRTLTALVDEMLQEIGETGEVQYGNTTIGRSVRYGVLQGAVDQNAVEYAPIVRRNTYRLEYEEDGVWMPTTQVTMVRGRLGITNAHITMLRNEHKWRIKNGSLTYGPFDLWTCAAAFPDNATSDVIMFEFPTNVMQHQNILPKFMKDSDFERFSFLNQLCLYNVDKKDYSVRTGYTQDVQYVSGTPFELRKNGETWRIINDTVRYAIPTASGDCGAVLVAFDASFHRKIVGIHSAGCDQERFQGVGQKISQELLSEMLKNIVCAREDSWMSPAIEKVQKKEPQTRVEGDRVIFPVKDAIVHAGEAQAFAYQPVKSNIYPSPVHEILGPARTRPARLKPFRAISGEIIDPMALARGKVLGTSKFIDEEQLAACVKDVSQMINRRINQSYQRQFTWVECIAGVEGDRFLPPINRRTSPGYGWPKRGVGKTWYLGLDDYEFDNEDLMTKRTEIEECLRRGERPTTVWVDTLKDERRSHAKVDAGKTRLFSVGEMAFVLIFRQYFMGFVAHMARNRIEVESCVGVNPYSYDWTTLGRRLQSMGKHVVAGDFTNYDGSLNSQILWSVLDVIEDFYVDDSCEQRKTRRLLWSEIVNSIHVCGNQLYMWDHSNPSGCPITTVLNSVYHSIAARYVFLECAKLGPEGSYDLALYRRCVRHANYGDDDVWNISEEIVEWFNQETMTHAFRAIGMTYTDEQKSSEVRRSRTLDEVTFLKRGFRWDESQRRFRAPLSLDTILEMPMWVRGKVDHYLLTSTTLCEAAHELAQHQESTFKAYIGVLEKARRVIDEKVPTRFETYNHYQRIEISRWINPALVLPQIRCDERETVIKRTEEMLQPSVSGTLQHFDVGTPMDSINTPAEEGTHDALLGTEVAEVQPQQVLTFSEDGASEEFVPRDTSILSYSSLASDALEHTVKDFLERPIIHEDFVWKPSDSPGVRKSYISLPLSWMYIKMIYEKLSGFRYLRCDFEIRLQVNAQPSNAGALIMSFIPFGDQMGYLPVDVMSYTGYRHVLLNPEQDTSAVLTVPFIHPEAYFDLTQVNRRLGTVHVNVFSQLRGGGNNVDCTVYFRAKNITLGMPTGIPIPKVEVPVSLVEPSEQTGEMQMAKGKSQEGKVMTKKGAISSALDVTADVADAVRGVPALGSVAEPLSWLARGLSGVAGMFGFSRPLDESTQQTVQQSYNRTMHNFAGDTKAKVMALDQLNSVRIPKEFFQSEEDEMSFKHVVAQPIAYERFTIAANNISGARVWTNFVKVGPWNNDSQINAISNQVLTHADFAALFFDYWRGEIVYHFKVFKTPFHSCRIRVFFVPGMRTSRDDFEKDKCYSEVFDIRERSDFTFRVPFSFMQAWAEVWPEYQSRIPGMIVVELQNALRFPPICADTIDIVVWKSMGPDAQFAFPHFRTQLVDFLYQRVASGATEIMRLGHTYDGVIPPTNVAKTGGEMQMSYPAHLCPEAVQTANRQHLAQQSAIDETVDERTVKSKKKTRKCRTKCVLLACGEIQMANNGVAVEQDMAPKMMREDTSPIKVSGMRQFDANQLTFGEIVTSYRQLLKRYELYSMNPISPVANKTWYVAPHVPYEAGVSHVDADSTVFENNNLMGLISVIYRFQCGSVNIGLHGAGNKSVFKAQLLPLGFDSDNFKHWGWKPNIAPDMRPACRLPIVVTQEEEVGVEFKVPHYINHPVRLTPAYIRVGNDATLGALTEKGPFLAFNGMSGMYMSRCVGEDFSFGYLLPPPMAAINNAAAAKPPMPQFEG